MSGPESTLPSPRRLHPLIATAAIAVVIASLTAVAAVTGILPFGKASPNPAEPAASPYSQTAPSQPAGSTTRPPARDTAQQAQVEPKPTPRPSSTAGHVTGVQVVAAEKPTSGLGALGGAVVGGLVGNQIGNGNGRILGTVAGAAAGGVGGNYAEKKLNTDKTYRVNVKMDDGSRRTFTYQNPPGVEVGERVHMEKGVLVRG
ncbi:MULTISPECIES: glycine zipper 2TM domain-containing protein [unclassified Cupriavidus]|uniref:glycine zipper 2TM domain-containing protein n=1 Tax=unclassified Cupriavidus TaxID=2640874 RepID=UPI0010F9B588|nr:MULTISPECIES: glycine zipper 2TM domain-containing protein [unclassified Cupriavidus]MWL86784.1 glycine zipper 2TM domain-containing protein [Cupriavidus sp. SW-Y-13]